MPKFEKSCKNTLKYQIEDIYCSNKPNISVKRFSITNQAFRKGQSSKKSMAAAAQFWIDCSYFKVTYYYYFWGTRIFYRSLLCCPTLDKNTSQCTIFTILLTLWNSEQKNGPLIKLFCFSSDFDETWWSCSYLCVLQFHQVSSKSRKSQKKFY